MSRTIFTFEMKEKFVYFRERVYLCNAKTKVVLNKIGRFSTQQVEHIPFKDGVPGSNQLITKSPMETSGFCIKVKG